MRTRSRTQIVLTLLTLTFLSLGPVLAQATETDGLASEDEKILYTIGLALAQQISVVNLSADELTLVQEGLTAAVLGQEPKVNLQEYGPKLQGFLQERVAKQAEAEKSESQAYVDGEAAKEGAVRTESGLVMTETVAGEGANPGATDTVTVHYHGTLRDGTVFDSSVDRGEPATFALNQVIPCWTEGLQRMKVGGKSQLVCPADIAYGDQGRPGIPGGAALTFDVELLGITAATTQAEGDNQ